jgi:hypothetical protein
MSVADGMGSASYNIACRLLMSVCKTLSRICCVACVSDVAEMVGGVEAHRESSSSHTPPPKRALSMNTPRVAHLIIHSCG